MTLRGRAAPETHSRCVALTPYAKNDHHCKIANMKIMLSTSRMLQAVIPPTQSRLWCSLGGFSMPPSTDWHPELDQAGPPADQLPPRSARGGRGRGWAVPAAFGHVSKVPAHAVEPDHVGGEAQTLSLTQVIFSRMSAAGKRRSRSVPRPARRSIR